MSPTSEHDPRGGLHGPTLWRTLILGSYLAVGGLAVFIAFFVIKPLASTAQANRDLNCRIGAFFVGTPIVQQPQQTDQEFHHVVNKAQSYLRAMKEVDCASVQGAKVTTEEINRTLHRLHRAEKTVTPEGGGHSQASSGLSPPSPARGASTPAPPAPPQSQPGSPPGTTTIITPPPTTTPSTTTTSPPPPPPPTCTVTALGIRVCLPTFGLIAPGV